MHLHVVSLQEPHMNHLMEFLAGSTATVDDVVRSFQDRGRDAEIGRFA